MTKQRESASLSALEKAVGALRRVSSTDIQNTFGRVIDDVRAAGTIVIERHARPMAVLMSVEAYEALRSGATQSQRLNELTGEFDALVARMQTPKGRAGLQRAFDASPAQLAAAASPVARPASPTRVASAAKPGSTARRRK